MVSFKDGFSTLLFCRVLFFFLLALFLVCRPRRAALGVKGEPEDGNIFTDIRCEILRIKGLVCYLMTPADLDAPDIMSSSVHCVRKQKQKWDLPEQQLQVRRYILPGSTLRARSSESKI